MSIYFQYFFFFFLVQLCFVLINTIVISERVSGWMIEGGGCFAGHHHNHITRIVSSPHARPVGPQSNSSSSAHPHFVGFNTTTCRRGTRLVHSKLEAPLATCDTQYNCISLSGSSVSLSFFFLYFTFLVY